MRKQEYAHWADLAKETEKVMLENIKSLVVRERNKLLPVVELLKVHKDH